MFTSIKLKNFRNFDSKEFFFVKNKNFIIWNNWVWKTNILEAISLVYQKNFLNQDVSSLVKKDEIFWFIEISKDDWKKFAISLDSEKNLKKLFINWKATTKKKFIELLEKIIIFQPMDMNMMYLSPSLRRDFLDDILWSTFDTYEKINKDYKNIIKNRNKLLKNIRDWKATKNELIFWDNNLVSKANLIYNYRQKLNSFLKENISIMKELLNFKVQDINYNYITKVDLNDIENSIKDYLNKNIDRDIIIWNTHIWPHIDDFDIVLDWFSLTNFASRWETKSVILWLKILETKFIELLTWKEIIFLIDDLFSELDEIHENLLLNELWDKQIIITSIKANESNSNNNMIYL